MSSLFSENRVTRSRVSIKQRSQHRSVLPAVQRRQVHMCVGGVRRAETAVFFVPSQKKHVKQALWIEVLCLAQCKSVNIGDEHTNRFHTISVFARARLGVSRGDAFRELELDSSRQVSTDSECELAAEPRTRKLCDAEPSVDVEYGVASEKL